LLGQTLVLLLSKVCGWYYNWLLGDLLLDLLVPLRHRISLGCPMLDILGHGDIRLQYLTSRRSSSLLWLSPLKQDTMGSTCPTYSHRPH